MKDNGGMVYQKTDPMIKYSKVLAIILSLASCVLAFCNLPWTMLIMTPDNANRPPATDLIVSVSMLVSSIVIMTWICFPNVKDDSPESRSDIG